MFSVKKSFFVTDACGKQYYVTIEKDDFLHGFCFNVTEYHMVKKEVKIDAIHSGTKDNLDDCLKSIFNILEKHFSLQYEKKKKFIDEVKENFFIESKNFIDVSPILCLT